MVVVDKAAVVGTLISHISRQPNLAVLRKADAQAAI